MFLLILIVVRELPPGVVLVEFSPAFGDDGAADVSGELVCETEDDTVTCSVGDPQRIDRVTATANGKTIVAAEEPPLAFDVERVSD